VNFQLAPATTGTPNALVTKGQTIELPVGNYNRVYVLAASADGDQNATFQAGSTKTQLDVENWGGFIGQWDDRQWSASNSARDNYGEMTGLKPGFIKRADLAWYCSHHHNAAGQNVAYSYSYLFGYGLDLPAGAKTLKLPNNDKIRILAISVAHENSGVVPVQPLYDVLPSPNAGAADFSLSTSPDVRVAQGRTATSRVLVMSRGSFSGTVKLTAVGLPKGVSATFDPASTSGTSVMTLTTSHTAAPATAAVTISGIADGLSRSTSTTLAVTPVLTGTVPVNLSSTYNVTGIYKDGAKFAPEASLDGSGFALSEQAIGSEQVGDEVVFKLGPAGAPDVVTGKTVALPEGKFASLKLLAIGVNGDQEMQTFAINYADGTSSAFTQSLSDWSASGGLRGESVALRTPYRLSGDGSTDANPFIACAYSFTLESTKEVRSISLPSNRDVLVLAVTLVPVGRQAPTNSAR
jgi:alpha-mannosidase